MVVVAVVTVTLAGAETPGVEALVKENDADPGMSAMPI